jgi:hypothetical protein
MVEWTDLNCRTLLVDCGVWLGCDLELAAFFSDQLYKRTRPSVDVAIHIAFVATNVN